MRSETGHTILPFTAIIGQEQMKLALILNAINPRIGGVLIRGEKGTAKSTAVRALAALLPEIRVVQGCPFSCDPDRPADLCSACREREESALHASTRPVRIVTLPLGATEDRVVGTLDLERAVREGITALDPGVLAAAHRGILYIDEVNLLDDHIVDILLDAAAMGVNAIEREGVSVSHPARFILIGTMNPEEGDLRPQLLDRFGLMVNVAGILDPEERMAIIAAAEEWETNPKSMEKRYAQEQDSLRSAITRAQEILPEVTIEEALVRSVVDVCLSLGITTHRAEIVTIRAAKAIAAFHGRLTATPSDVREAMSLALPHRMRKRPFEDPKIDPAILDRMVPDDEPEEDEGPEESPGDGQGGDGPPASGGAENTHAIGPEVHTAPIWQSEESERRFRKTARGRMIETPTEDKRGRRTTIAPSDEWRGIAIDATLRAAAPHQKTRARDGTAISVRNEDLRKPRLTGKAEVACVFVVDASGSMGADMRMESAKGAVLSLLQDAYINRDRVGLVAFRGTSAEVVLPLTRSPELAYHSLSAIPTGGKTPLAAGLLKGMELLDLEKRKRRDILPMMMLISDGRANTGSGPVREELKTISGAIAASEIRMVVIDTESAQGGMPLSLGYCREIAEGCLGSYYALSDLSSGAVESIARIEQGVFFGS